MRATITATAICGLILSGCGGGGTGGGGGGPIAVAPTPSPTPTPPATGTCSLSARQSFARQVIDEWFLYPAEVATSTNPASFGNVDDYIDALVAPARASGKDRFFTYITSIAEENAFFASGSSAGFGVRFAFDSAQRLRVTEAFEGAPGLAAGLDRGTEIVGIGTTTTNVRSVANILASEGSAGVNAALGPSTAGTSRVLQIRNAAGTSTVTVVKADFSLTPISDRYGVKIIEEGGQRYGYLNMRTFISSANDELRTAFQTFREAGVTRIVVDFRYNGGGLVSTAELMGDLLGRDRFSSELFSQTTFRPEKASNNRRKFFAPQPQSISPVRIAFIGTGATASASEFVINGMLPYLGANVALVGSNTFGKPVGQIAIDQAACDDRMRVVAFATGNRETVGDYFAGMAPKMQATCAAPDDIERQLGDPQETALRRAIDFLAGRPCGDPIQGAGAAAAGDGLAPQTGRTALTSDDVRMLRPAAPTPAQREVPGLY